MGSGGEQLQHSAGTMYPPLPLPSPPPRFNDHYETPKWAQDLIQKLEEMERQRIEGEGRRGDGVAKVTQLEKATMAEGVGSAVLQSAARSGIGSKMPQRAVPQGEVSGEVLGEAPGEVSGEVLGAVPGEVQGEVPGVAPGEVRGEVSKVVFAFPPPPLPPIPAIAFSLPPPPPRQFQRRWLRFRPPPPPTLPAIAFSPTPPPAPLPAPAVTFFGSDSGDGDYVFQSDAGASPGAGGDAFRSDAAIRDAAGTGTGGSDVPGHRPGWVGPENALERTATIVDMVEACARVGTPEEQASYMASAFAAAIEPLVQRWQVLGKREYERSGIEHYDTKAISGCLDGIPAATAGSAGVDVSTAVETTVVDSQEWHLKCSPYFVLTTSKGMEPSWTPLLPSMTVPGHDGPVRSAGSVTAALCAVHSEISGLGRYGHRSVLIKPNVILTTGGFGEEDGQHCCMRSFHMLIKHAGCWKAGCLKKENPDKRWDERLYHSVSCLSNSLALVVGGQTSPSSADLGMLGLKLPETCNASDPDDTSVEPVSLQPEPAALRWRHSATEVIFKGKKYLFLYGGRSAMEPVLGDWCFQHTRELSCTVIPVEGAVPESRHSHSACSWKGGALIAGGLGAAEQPLGSVFFLRELEHGFQWQRVETRPPLIPRGVEGIRQYSHSVHVHDGKLLLVGGVWFHSSSVPGITVIDIMTGLCLNCTINVEHLEWPLMLHNHSSVFLPDEEELLLIGGGGNCFSFGTHLNPEPVSLSLSSILTSH
ncbi:tRNA wybutosine-synthesizing protein 4-like [Aegotheles albertisi]